MSGEMVDIELDLDELLKQISTSDLEQELEKRHKRRDENAEAFEFEEKGRGGTIEATIDPIDYDLIHMDDVRNNISDISDDEIFGYLKRRGYIVLPKDMKKHYEIDSVVRFIDELYSWEFRDAMCDLVGLSHLSQKEDIIDKLRERM